MKTMQLIAIPTEKLEIINDRLSRIEELISSNPPSAALPILNSKEVCEYLHISRRTLARLIRDNRISFIRSGRKLLFRESDINEYLQKNSNPLIES